jgi:citronellyl-CoA synthetase
MTKSTFFSRLTDVASTTVEFARLLYGNSRLPKELPETLQALVAQQVRERPDATMIVTNGGELSWAEFQRLANQISRLVESRGVGKGDSVSVMMENHPTTLASVIGIAQLGAVAAMVNTNLSGRQLQHCITETGSTVALVDAVMLDPVLEVCESCEEVAGKDLDVLCFGKTDEADTPDRVLNAEDLVSGMSDADYEPGVEITAEDPVLYLYTSGTTGLPKAAIITHHRCVDGAIKMAIMGARAKPRDRMYICLPLYHGTGLTMAVGVCLASGASMYLGKKFSASRFLEEVRRYKCTQFAYVGELCRYLVNTPRADDDAINPLHTVLGVGLRPEIWHEFRSRFGVRRVCEFYTASEANGGFVNLMNKDATIGITGNTAKLVRYSMEDSAPLLGDDGFVVEVEPGADGLLLIQTSDKDRYHGYLDAEASESKLVRDAFAEGDCWFNSGDLLRQVDVGFAFGAPHYQFVDRLGDTFRWKAENVSTAEVADILCSHPGIRLAAVYGVTIPGTDGKAGMVTLELSAEVDLKELSLFVQDRLTAPARPRFIRVSEQLDTTGTHKIVKTRLVEEHYDPDVVSDPLYFLDVVSGDYLPLTPDAYHEIQAGKTSF